MPTYFLPDLAPPAVPPRALPLDGEALAAGRGGDGRGGVVLRAAPAARGGRGRAARGRPGGGQRHPAPAVGHAGRTLTIFLRGKINVSCKKSANIHVPENYVSGLLQIS